MNSNQRQLYLSFTSSVVNLCILVPSTCAVMGRPTTNLVHSSADLPHLTATSESFFRILHSQRYFVVDDEGHLTEIATIATSQVFTTSL